MKPDHKKFILDNRSKLSAAQLAERLGLKERKIKKILEQEKERTQRVGEKQRVQEESTQKPVGILGILFVIATIFLITFAGYFNTLKSPFLWDDINLVKNNPDMKSWKTAPKVLRENLGYGVVQQKSSSYRPLQSLSYIIDHTFWKEEVFGYHLTNTLLHALAGVCAFWLILTIFKDFPLALFTSLIYAVHPIHTEAVTYISGRADPLSTVFLLTSLICYIKYINRPSVVALFFSGLTFAAALGSRENAIILPVLALLYHYVFKKPIRWSALGTLLGIGVCYIILRMTETLGAIGESQTLGTTIMQRLPGTFVAMTNYVRLIFFPTALHMEYGRPVFPWSDPAAWIGIVIIAGMVALAVRTRQKNPLVCFGLLWFLINIIPVSNIVPVNAYMAEHWLYIPSIGIILIICYYARLLFEKPAWRNAVLIAVFSVTALFGYLTYQQNRTWQDPITFYQGLIKYAPNSARLYSDLSTAFFSENRYDEAIEVLKKAIQLKPDYAFAHNNIGAIYNAKKQYDLAIPHLKKAIQFNKDYDVANFNLGNAYKDSGQQDLAIKHYEEALRINPRYFDAYDALGIIYGNRNDLPKAIEYYQKAIALNPDGPRAYNNLGSAYLKFGKLKEAKDMYDKALSFSPTHPGILHNLGNIAEQMGDKPKAIEYYERAVQLNSPHPDTYRKLANIYQSQGKLKEAQELIEKAKNLK